MNMTQLFHGEDELPFSDPYEEQMEIELHIPVSVDWPNVQIIEYKRIQTHT